MKVKMSSQLKYILALLLVSISFILMVSLKPVGTLGDYLLRGIGLNPWSGDNRGIHLTVIYFAVPFFIGVVLLGIYRRESNIGGFRTILYAVILIACFGYVGIEAFENIKGQADGLLTIGIDADESMYHIDSDEWSVDFDIQLKLVNYADEDKVFKLEVDNKYKGEGDHWPVPICDLNGERSIFKLHKNETKIFNIDSEYYAMPSIELDKSVSSMSSTGNIQQVILESLDGEKVLVNSEGFFGVVLEIIR